MNGEPTDLARAMCPGKKGLQIKTSSIRRKGGDFAKIASFRPQGSQRKRLRLSREEREERAKYGDE